MSYLEGLLVKGGVNVVLLDGNHGLADVIQSREIGSGLNRIYGEGNVNLITYELSNIYLDVGSTLWKDDL